GIEIEGADGIPYEATQYRAAAAAVAALAAAYPVLAGDPERIVSHAEIAPGRKTDPWDSFDWGRFRREIDAQSS
ncbi:MAG TPA: N-acetylmuramoyl-L-alanine amidase, partial [Thermoanaerobaculia bacterium]